MSDETPATARPKLGATELMRRIGDDHVMMQNLTNVITDARLKRVKGGSVTLLTFGTEAIQPSDLMGAPRKVGLLFWVDAKHLAKIHADWKQEHGLSDDPSGT